MREKLLEYRCVYHFDIGKLELDDKHDYFTFLCTNKRILGQEKRFAFFCSIYFCDRQWYACMHCFSAALQPRLRGKWD